MISHWKPVDLLSALNDGAYVVSLIYICKEELQHGRGTFFLPRDISVFITSSVGRTKLLNSYITVTSLMWWLELLVFGEATDVGCLMSSDDDDDDADIHSSSSF